MVDWIGTIMHRRVYKIAGWALAVLMAFGVAAQDAKDPGVDSLIATAIHAKSSIFPDGDPGSPGEKALALLRKDHIRSEKLGPLCQWILFGFHRSHEEFLRAVIEQNPHHDVQGLACLSLAEFFMNRSGRLEVIREQPELAERYYGVFGKQYIDELQRPEQMKAAATEAETLFERAAEKYADVKIPVTYYGSGGLIGDKAKGELFKIRRLALGKEAPDIQGFDQDGIPFKLSDYRGKVVLLDFWHRL